MRYMRNPSAGQMREFAAKYSQSKWDYMCCNPDFVKAVVGDLKKAKKLADRMMIAAGYMAKPTPPKRKKVPASELKRKTS